MEQVLTFRTLSGRIGALALHATHDPKETTANARAAFLASFEYQVDPERTLPDAERERRAMMARRLHFTRLALKSAKARASRPATNKKAAAGQAAATGEVGDAGAALH